MHEAIDASVPPGGAESATARLGIVGGGQLARMTAMAALRLGCDVVVLERNPFSPASVLAMHALVGDWNDPDVLRALAARVDVVTFENEFVNADAVACIEGAGWPVYPRAATLALVQDKLHQKRHLAAAGTPVVAAEPVASLADARAAADRFGYPVVLKARRNAYDGRGNATVRDAAELPAAWERLGGASGRELFVEAWCPFVRELAVIVTRGRDGTVVAYPVAETTQRHHICHMVRAPADVPEPVAAEAARVARAVVEAVDGVGTFGVELFLLADGRVLLNEVAPRVHNSGHYTDDACACSQFENHVRAVLGMPLGSPAMVAPAAVMVNLLGTAERVARPTGLDRALAVPGAAVHLYGKRMSGPGRKLGHVTALGATVAEAEAIAIRCAGHIGFGEAA